MASSPPRGKPPFLLPASHLVLCLCRSSSGELEPLLQKLIPAVGGRRAAQRELRWMRDALSQARSSRAPPLGDLASLVARRTAGEPLQYVLGTQPFGPLELLVRPPTLIPRPETEQWATTLAEKLMPPKSVTKRVSVLDLCTGTGCIPLLLLKSWPASTAHATAVDISRSAVDLARDNALEHDVPVVDSFEDGLIRTKENSLSIIQADILNLKALLAHPSVHSSLPFDVITSNPPYIPMSEYVELDPSVKDWEDPRALLGDPTQVLRSQKGSSSVLADDLEHPVTSLFGGDQAARAGLTFYHAIAQLAAHPGVLRQGGPLVLEVGHNQSDAVSEILSGVGSHGREAVFAKIEIWDDHFGRQRAVVGYRT